MASTLRLAVFVFVLIIVVGLVGMIYCYNLEAGLNQTPSSTGSTFTNTVSTTTVGNEISGQGSTSSWSTPSSTTINSPVNENEVETTDNQSLKITDPNYAGWKGMEGLIKPYSKYVVTLMGTNGFTGDFFWPFVSSENPLKELLSVDDIALVRASINNITGVQLENVYAYVVYEVKIDRVIKNASIPNTSLIKEGNLLEVKLTAFISKDAIKKKNLTIKDVATPFPLLNPGNTYLLFLQITPAGVRVYYDFVWGPYAYIITDNKVYSLNYIEYPVELEPIEFFEDDNISWEWGTYTYSELRQLAIQKLEAYAVPLDDFIRNILN